MAVTSTAIQQPRVLVQSAIALPSSDAGWTSHPFVRFVGGSEAALPAIGEATLEVPAGALIPESGNRIESVAFSSAIGRVIRLLKEDSTGDIRVNGVRFTAFWWGQAISETHTPEGGTGRLAGGVTTVHCSGILSFLDQACADSGHVKAGSAAVPIGFLPPLNDDGWPRSSGTVSGLPGGAVNVFDPGNTATTWTAAQFLDYILAAFAPLGIASWQISGDTSALAYTPERHEWNGATVLQILLGMIDPQRGITGRVSVSGRTVTIIVRTGTPTAIELGGFTLPANADTVSFTAASLGALNISIEENRESVYGTLIARGDRPIVGLTGSYAGASTDLFGKGWDAGNETAWQSAPADHPTVFRRFVVQSGWNGLQFDGSEGLRGTLTRATSADHGTQGLTGDRTTGTAGIPGTAIELVGRIPNAAKKGEWAKPVILVRKGSTYLNKTKDWSLDIEEYPPAIVIDDGAQGRLIRDFLAASWQILISLGVREVQPLTVSYAGSADRVKVIDVRDIELWRIAAGMRTSASASASASTPRDDTDRLRSTLPMLRARFGESDWTLQFTSPGQLDIDVTGQPAQLITEVDRGDSTLTVNVVTTRRAWSLHRTGDGEYWETSYIANRILPNAGAVL